MPTEWNKALRTGVNENFYDDPDITAYEVDNISYDGVFSFEATIWTKRTEI